MGLPYATFSEPDGNSWPFQETTGRLPGTTDARTTICESDKDLGRALCSAAAGQDSKIKRRSGKPTKN